MKIGVVHFGWASAGTAQIVRTLIEGLSKEENTVYGIECNKTTKDIELKELSNKDLSKFGSHRYELSIFPPEIWTEQASALANSLGKLDKIILLGQSEANLKQLAAKTLQVPISIFNHIDGSQLTLGYDTAFNAIVKNIESVRDTASSLSYGKVRVFNVQIPGAGPSKLLEHTALAVEAEVVKNSNEETIAKLKQHIREKEANKEGYTFFIMDQTVNPEHLAEHFKEFDLDWKVVEIDESQCGGPYPTALDQLLANQLKKAVVDWTLSDQPSGQLLIHDNQALFEEINSISEVVK
ncbi:6-phosphofructokinase [uncultured Metabacillus sp.]|uniref:6-phosphofructokinase n=1 Tax=uncultured Metabacillus sp. TaxID=2860135 RepID=UPI0026091C55|nr:6-phosphofructokinase [uncultured Metabacillus sp.]